MPRTILIVDDSSDTVEVLRRSLAARGYAVVGQTDPEKVLAQITPEVGLIFLDIVMPNLDGLTLCKRIKATPVGAAIPVVILTAQTAREKEWEALRAGAKLCLHKPVRLSRLLEVVIDEIGMSDTEAKELLKEFRIAPKPPSKPKSPPPPPPPSKKN